MPPENESYSCSSYLESNTKRFLDISVSIAILPFLALTVLPMLVISLFFNGRPFFFQHQRVGKNGKLVDICKIRTLKLENNSYKCSPSSNSTRIIRMGRFLRKHKIDEVPQIISVIKGELSLVGPRPEMPFLAKHYKKNHLKRRMMTRPGLTGLWQIKADISRPIYEEIKYDLYYVRKASLMLDFRILIATLIFVIKNKVV